MTYINNNNFKEVGKRIILFCAYLFVCFVFISTSQIFKEILWVKNLLTIALVVCTVLFFKSQRIRKILGIEEDEFVYFRFSIKAVFITFLLVIFIFWFGITFLNNLKFVKEITTKILLNSILSAISTAIVEEFLFRYIPLTNIKNKINQICVIFFSALVFSYSHSFSTTSVFLYPYLLYVFLGGILFGLLYIYSKSIWLVISVHAGVNVYARCIYEMGEELNDKLPSPLSVPSIMILLLIIIVILLRNRFTKTTLLT